MFERAGFTRRSIESDSKAEKEATFLARPHFSLCSNKTASTQQSLLGRSDKQLSRFKPPTR